MLGTDFTPESDNALLRATDLAVAHGASVHVVHVARRLPSALARKFSFLDEGKLRDRLNTMVEGLRAAGVAARAHLSHGELVKALTAKARALAADLVIVGARGRTVPDMMIGSTAERLIALDRPRVLLVRRPAKRPYNAVVIAANEDSDLRKQVEAAALFSTERPSLLHVYEGLFEASLALHGMSPAERNEYRAAARRGAAARMAKRLEKARIEDARLVLRYGRASHELQRIAPDSLLVLSRGGSVVRELLLGSVTRAVVAHGRSDLLLV
jgi:nucleotide-binding universal stress UspA family protein